MDHHLHFRAGVVLACNVHHSVVATPLNTAEHIESDSMQEYNYTVNFNSLPEHTILYNN